MSPEQLALYFATCRAAGVPDSEIEAAIAESDRQNAALDASKCPGCGAAIGRQRDRRQIGPHNVPGGVWFNYVCEACGYHVDRAESVPENLS